MTINGVKLSPAQIGLLRHTRYYGCVDNIRAEAHDHLDMRTLKALERKGLVVHRTHECSPWAWLTHEGMEIYEILRRQTKEDK